MRAARTSGADVANVVHIDVATGFLFAIFSACEVLAVVTARAYDCQRHIMICRMVTLLAHVVRQRLICDTGAVGLRDTMVIKYQEFCPIEEAI